MRYRIVNRFRFITFVTSLILIITMALAGLFNTVTALGNYEERFIEVTICEGDTLWDIAQNYGPSDMDIREVIYQIGQVNNLDTCKIYPGQIILVPAP